MNYTILVVPAAMIFLWIYWHVSVKNWFTGPKHTIDTTSATKRSPSPVRASEAPHRVSRTGVREGRRQERARACSFRSPSAARS